MPRLVILAVAAMLLLSGCVGGSGTGPAETTEQITTEKTTTERTTSSPPINNSTAIERAVSAEISRNKDILEGEENFSDRASYKQSASVVERNGTGIVVTVTVRYGYQYSCDSKAGHVDGATKATYFVTEEREKVINRSSDIKLICT